MNKTVQTVLTVLCALMILTLPFLVPSPKLLETAVERILEETPEEPEESDTSEVVSVPVVSTVSCAEA